MKKHLPNCAECGENKSILTQISAGPEAVLLCSDCYNFKYSKEIYNEIRYFKEEEEEE
tara:strand:- start:123 stop:296 length:174 start_codon:yes stop_codon:yes gene_type:complete